MQTLMLSFVLACVILGAPVGSGGTEIERVVAVVDKEVITETELLTEARVALAMRSGERAASAPLDPELVRSFRDYVVDQTLVAIQVRRLGSVEISDEEIDEHTWQFMQRFNSTSAYHAFLRRFGINEGTVRDILARDLRNDRYIAQRMRTRMLGASGGVQTSGVSPEALKTWLKELRHGSELRLLGPEGDLELQGRNF
jgi:hypothetical protein